MEETSKLQFLVDSLKEYTEDLTILSPNDPFIFRVNGSIYSIHVSPVHDSGNMRPNPNEDRIQVPTVKKNLQSQRETEGMTPLFIGLFPAGDVFSAWEPEYVFSLRAKKQGTVYARGSHRNEVIDQGGAFREFPTKYLGRSSRLISLRSSFLGLYLENCDLFHEVRSLNDLLSIVALTETATEVPIPSQTVSTEIEVGDRAKVMITRTAYPRDPKFSRNVLSAYGHSCAICSKQLGLVQAAHIIPHNQDDCPNDVTNGIALCAEHHKLYDDALLLPGPNRSLHLNPARVEHLRNIGQGEGLDDVASLARNQFKLPNDPAHHPNAEYLRRGVNIRLGVGD